jgi:hypothetical protein
LIAFRAVGLIFAGQAVALTFVGGT